MIKDFIPMAAVVYIRELLEQEQALSGEIRDLSAQMGFPLPDALLTVRHNHYASSLS